MKKQMTWVYGLLFIAASASAQNEHLRKYDLALSSIGVPAEKAPDFSDFPIPASMSRAEVESILPFIDPDQELRKYMDLRDDSVTFYQDSLKAYGATGNPIEFTLPFGTSPSQDSPELMRRLGAVAAQVQASSFGPFRLFWNTSKALSGLRVVIDPGHMGDGRDWDNGKWVKYGGKEVYEGRIALATAFLLANELEALGAEVLLTRTELKPVAIDFSQYDPRNEFNQSMYKGFDLKWLDDILKKKDQDIPAAMASAKQVKTPPSKAQFYLQADLDARAKIFEAYKPDLFIDIHYDANYSDKLQSSSNDVSALVPGAARQGEFGSRNARARLLKHALEVRRWKQSVKIAKTMVDGIAKNMNIPTLKNAYDATVKVDDGVFARNLFQTNRSVDGLTVFFECAHYDHSEEFYKLANVDSKDSYKGRTFNYPSRVKKVSDAMRDGIVKYFSEFQL